MKNIASFDPLKWWREQHVRYPLLSDTARRVLVLTASSAECERHFSACTDVESDNDNDKVMSNSDRFFVIHSSDEGDPISKLSPFAIDKSLKCKIGTLNTNRKLRSGDILVELSSSSQIQAITKLKHIMDRPVTATPHKTLNSCKGVIRCRKLVDCDRDEALNELKSQNVSDLTNILVKDSSGGGAACKMGLF